jgi:hypothetical protein
VAILDDEPGDTERCTGGEQVGGNADDGNHRCLERDQEQKEAERHDDADHPWGGA